VTRTGPAIAAATILACGALLWIWGPVLTPSDSGACSPQGDDPSRGKAVGQAKSYRWSESRAIPPGRVCRVYADDGDGLTPIATKTYPEPAKYGWVALAFALPFLVLRVRRRWSARR
jgi:hypothetical protein